MNFRILRGFNIAGKPYEISSLGKKEYNIILLGIWFFCFFAFFLVAV